MSWPSDGEPRFKVVELGGFNQRGGRYGTDVLILDRANCHRVVRNYSTGYPLTISGRRARAANVAKRLENRHG